MGYTIKPTSGTQKAATRKGGDGRVRTESITESILPGSMKKRKTYTRVEIKENAQLWLLMLPTIALILVFSYIPMYGILIAFQKYLPGKDIIGPNAARWVGLANFRKFVSSVYFPRILRNTVILSLYSLAFGFLAPILFALLLDQIRALRFKKFLQTVSYMPHFISTVVLCSMVIQFLNARVGMINSLLGLFGVPAVNYMGKKEYYYSIYVWSGVWQDLGYSSIIYIAALSGVSPELHEAAIVDGASILRRIRHIDIPSVLPTFCILLIMRCGSLLSVGFEKALLLQNPLNMTVSEVISTYSYNISLNSTSPQFSYAAAIGLFTSVINLIVLCAVNGVVGRVSDNSIF